MTTVLKTLEDELDRDINVDFPAATTHRSRK
jgi:hypothetical protein